MSVTALCRGVCLGLAACFAWSATSHAAMQLNRTRLVLHEAESSVVIEVQHQDTQPLLLQAWIDTGQEDDAPAPPADLPWMVDPPVVRLEPGQAQALRVWFTRGTTPLAADRESLFWLNVLEVPLAAAADDPQDTHLALAVQSRLKLFYRPHALAGISPGQLGDSGRLRFTLARDGQNLWLDIHNPAPIHQTLAHLVLMPVEANTRAITLAEAPMLAPFARTRLVLPAAAQRTRWRLEFATLDDEGNLIEDAQAL